MHIGNSSKGRDLTHVTNDLWKNFYEKKVGKNNFNYLIEMIQYKKELVLSGGNYMRQRHRHWKRSQEKLRWFVTYKMLKGNSSKTKSLGKYCARFLLRVMRNKVSNMDVIPTRASF